MSEWQPQVVVIQDVERHPNADTLSIAKVLDIYRSIIKTGELIPGDKAFWIPIDSDLDTARPEFSFLAPKARGSGKHRLRALKLRQIFSEGLLLPVPDGTWEVGQDITEHLGLEKYLPPSEREFVRKGLQSTKKARVSETRDYELKVLQASTCVVLIFLGLAYTAGSWLMTVAAPVIYAAAYIAVKKNREHHRRPNLPFYDISSILHYPNAIQDGEIVSVTEKLHGSNAAFVFTKILHMKSRNIFRGNASDKGNPWGFNFDDVWVGIANKYDLESKLAKHPGKVLWGEIVGPAIQAGYDYGLKSGETAFYAFDVMELETRRFLNQDELEAFCKDINVPMVPQLYVGPYNVDALRPLAEGMTTVPGANHVREGYVAKPVIERHDDKCGRVQFKMVGEGYKLRPTKDEE